MYQRDCKISSSSCVNLGALFNLIFSILLVLFVFLLVLLILCWFISVIMRVSFLLQLLVAGLLGHGGFKVLHQLLQSPVLAG